MSKATLSMKGNCSVSSATRAGLNWVRVRTGAAGIVFGIVWFFPVYWMTVTAFKPSDEIMTATTAFMPKRLSLENFRSAMFQTAFLINLKNSVVVTFFAVLVSAFFEFFACAALTLYRFKSRRVIMVLILAMQMLPGVFWT
ncbi:N,N'-diacetylchitobiose transport system permease protein [Bifidobacterium commune]|uniref:N,N'-diacetylchitobiose transport system permease protein n=1 Tax=Bifidobacterium commune TaxID=1505727 RepID=A0A1C4H113_9BIFI|nr:carbohydrate ABC transporter permease [Bifidobacterium commune]MBB2955169.1 N,N'-diacetylchitobiose transport system permease protein [Bifidobacterium commune]SCC78248.1 N,N'-diacetylchitobiose transport system permease protein [Bifidobacterium commune]